MRLDKFTVKAQEAIEAAQASAQSRNHQQVDAEHVLLALLEQQDGVVPPMLQKVGADPRALAAQVAAELDRMPRVHGVALDQLYITPRLRRIFDEALRQAQQLKDDYVSTEHLLAPMVDDQGAAGRVL
jgi:ATP-dependent Clp protease ATP-binding subunit ClpB